ncbi:MAG: YaeQ family protein [Vicinamibacteraceae bacterium]
MALTATIYRVSVELAHIDRGVYETIDLRLARHPSETLDYMATRLLAYCLEYTEGIALTDGVSSGDEPAIIVRDLTGKLTAWIEVGLPSWERLHRGHKQAGRAAVYTHRGITQVLGELNGHGIHRAADIPIVELDRGFVTAFGESLDRRSTMSLSVTEGTLYVDVDGRHLESQLTIHRLTP